MLVFPAGPAGWRPAFSSREVIIAETLFEELESAKSRKEKSMNEQDRVLIRKGARELDREETGRVSGSLGTLTACTWDPDFGKDGDASIGEC